MTPETIQDPRQGELFMSILPHYGVGPGALPPWANVAPYTHPPVRKEPAGVVVEPSDPVVRPNHYARYAIEPITFIMANNLPYAVGNVVKYICRFDAKNGDEDIRKAMRYCEILLEQRKREREGTVKDCVGNPL